MLGLPSSDFADLFAVGSPSAASLIILELTGFVCVPFVRFCLRLFASGFRFQA
jgi:hypothetical protein